MRVPEDLDADSLQHREVHIRLKSHVGTGDVKTTLPARLPGDASSLTVPNRASDLHADSPTISSSRDLGAMVREIRRAKGLSQQEFADLAGVGRRFISEFESGKSTVEMDKALKVARSIGIVLIAKRA